MAIPTEALPERLGSVFAVPLMLFFVALLLFVALLQAQQELIVLCLVTIGIMAGAYLWSLISLKHTDFRVKAVRAHLFPGEKVEIDLDVINAKALPIHMTVAATVPADLKPTDKKNTLKQSSGLLGYQQATFRWHLTAIRRGVYTIGPLQVTAGDPFGFFPRPSQIPSQHEIIVFPRLIPINAKALPRREAFGVPGGYSPVSDPVHILGTRDYQPSEPARHIHWKASARHRRLQTKVFAPSQQEKTLLLLDVAGFDRLGDTLAFERTLEVIASLAEQKDRQGYATGFLTNAIIDGPSRAILPPARNPLQMAMILETLARCGRQSRIDLLGVLRHRYGIPSGTSCALFTANFDDQAQLIQASFARRKTPLKIFSIEKIMALREEPDINER